MSLVVPRYTKNQPEVSAWLKRADSPPDYETYDGGYGLYRVDIAPAGGGPPAHFRRAMSEAFCVLSGRMKLYDGNEWANGHQGASSMSRPAGSMVSAMRRMNRHRS